MEKQSFCEVVQGQLDEFAEKHGLAADAPRFSEIH